MCGLAVRAVGRCGLVGCRVGLCRAAQHGLKEDACISVTLTAKRLASDATLSAAASSSSKLNLDGMYSNTEKRFCWLVALDLSTGPVSFGIRNWRHISMRFVRACTTCTSVRHGDWYLTWHGGIVMHLALRAPVGI